VVALTVQVTIRPAAMEDRVEQRYLTQLMLMAVVMVLLERGGKLVMAQGGKMELEPQVCVLLALSDKDRE
jgi:hypothetical protein